jgi:hypothetical protein
MIPEHITDEWPLKVYVQGYTINNFINSYERLHDNDLQSSQCKVIKNYCTMLHLFDDLWLDKIIPKNNDEGRAIYGNLEIWRFMFKVTL